MSSERTLLIITTTTKSEEKKSQNYYHHKFTISIQENFPREFVITNSQIQLGIWKMRPPDGKSCSAVNYKPSFFGLQHCSYIFNTAAISSTLLYIFNTAAAISSTSTVFAAIIGFICQTNTSRKAGNLGTVPKFCYFLSEKRTQGPDP